MLHASLIKLSLCLLEHFLLLIQLRLSTASGLVGTLQMSLFLLFGGLFDFFHLSVEFCRALGLGHLNEAWPQLELDLVLDFCHCSKLEV